MFKKLFQPIATFQTDGVKSIYNDGVNALARGDLTTAIPLFEQICQQHPSAAYNLGLIYLDGVGQFTPKYDLARKYLKIANELGHERAEWSAQIIGLDGERKLSAQEQMEFTVFAVAQYIQGKQLGNLAYLIAYDIKRNILETSSNEIYSLYRFLSYEVYCIRNYGNEDVMALYENSSLTNWNITDEDDWESGRTAVISDYLNEKVTPFILSVAGGELSLEDLGTVRLAAVNAAYEYYL
nr:hypothetical protein [uncultured Haemophilus sp.]